MVVDSVTDIVSPPVFMRLTSVIPQTPVYLKLEGLNVTGSIKLKTARRIVDDLHAKGRLRLGSRLIESSSGNLGVALAFICAERGYEFTCVSDPNIAPAAARLIQALGGRVIVVKERDSQGGYLKTRLDLIQKMVAKDPALVWTNQYANRSNARAHYLTTGREILERFPAPNWVFIGAGTTGTLAGTGLCLREESPDTEIVAVDSVGSVTFGGIATARFLPGIGTSCRPPLADDCQMDRLILVPEERAATMCRYIARQHGLLLGPSTGSVLVAVQDCAADIRSSDIVIAISPDFGDRYIETLYNDTWLQERFPGIQLREFGEEEPQVRARHNS